MENYSNEIDLEFTPHTKAILEIYTKALDGEIVITNKYLKSELKRLHQTSNLPDLIIFEYMMSSDYEGRTEVSLADVNLNYTPHTKHLLKQYIINQSEGTIEPTLENLKEVLLDLYRDDNLITLFEGEWIYSPGGIKMNENIPLNNFKEKESRDYHKEINDHIKSIMDFKALDRYTSYIKRDEWHKVLKKYKYVSLTEDKKDIVFLNEPLTSIHVPLEKSSKAYYRKIYDIIHAREEKTTHLIKEYFNGKGIVLPDDFRIALDPA